MLFTASDLASIISHVYNWANASFSCNKREVGWPKVPAVSAHGEAVWPPHPGLTSPPQLPVQGPSPGLRTQCLATAPAARNHRGGRPGSAALPAEALETLNRSHVDATRLISALLLPLASPAFSPAVKVYEGLVSAFASAVPSPDSWPPGRRASLPAASIAGR